MDYKDRRKRKEKESKRKDNNVLRAPTKDDSPQNADGGEDSREIPVKKATSISHEIIEDSSEDEEEVIVRGFAGNVCRT